MLRFTVFRRSWLRRDLEGATGSGVLVVSDDELSKAPDLPRYNAQGSAASLTSTFTAELRYELLPAPLH